MEERVYYLGFSSFSGIGPHKFSLLFDYFKSAKAAWEASKVDLLEAKLGEKTVEKFIEFRKTFNLEEYARRLLVQGVSFVTLDDVEYPERLKEIPNAPFLLYVKGDKNLLNRNRRDERDSGYPKGTSSDGHRSGASQNDEEKGIDPWFAPQEYFSLREGANRDDRPLTKYIAVVGTRRITSYGETVTRSFTQSLVEVGCVIVSGLAMGVDAVAHQTTIENKGKTIAVLGCGVDCCSPRENQRLYNSIIASGGAIISEFPLSSKPTIGSFPSRNRIVAGLSDAVLVTEGAEDSGALITADFGLEYGRKAFAIPGNITSSLSKGPYKLLKKGGILATTAAELMIELGVRGVAGVKSDKGKNIRGDTKEEQKILDLLSEESLKIDELIKRTGIASAEIGAIVSLMEIKGIIHLSDGYYAI